MERSELLGDGTVEDDIDNDNEIHLSKRRWGVLLCYCVATLSANSGFFAFTSVSNLTQEYYGVSMTAVNWLSIVYTLMFLPLAIPYSYLTNKLGLRFILILLTILDFSGAIVRYVGKDRNGYMFLLLGCILSASALAGILLQPAKIASVWFGERERALATGIGVAMDATGMALGFLQSAIFVGQNGANHVQSKHFDRLLLTQSFIGLMSFLFALIFAADKPDSPPTWSQAFADELVVQNDVIEMGMIGRKENSIEYDTDSDSNDSRNDIGHSKQVPPFDKTQKKARRSYWGDLICLLQNYQFLIIVHLHAIIFTLDSIFLTFLNELLVPKFPKQEFYISMMGACAILGSTIGNLAIGLVIDRTKRHKLCTFIIFSLTTVFCIIFGLLYYCSGVLGEMFVVLWLLELVMTCYFTVAFEQSAEATFPVSESAFSVLLILSGELYSFILTAIGTALLSDFGPASIFTIIFLLTFAGLIGSVFLKDLNIRSFFDKRNNKNLMY